MARGNTVSERPQRLRDLAARAENIAALALVADETLAKARQDVVALASAARMLAAKLETEALTPATNGGAA
jgi:hypothetical protein